MWPRFGTSSRTSPSPISHRSKDRGLDVAPPDPPILRNDVEYPRDARPLKRFPKRSGQVPDLRYANALQPGHCNQLADAQAETGTIASQMEALRQRAVADGLHLIHK